MKNVESENNKILYENLLDFFLQRNGTYCVNKSRRKDSAVLKPYISIEAPFCSSGSDSRTWVNREGFYSVKADQKVSTCNTQNTV